MKVSLVVLVAGSADSGIAEQPTMSPEQCVLQEVMDTETVYVADLREVIQVRILTYSYTPATGSSIRRELDLLFIFVQT